MSCDMHTRGHRSPCLLSTFLSASLACAQVTSPRSLGVVAFPAPISRGGTQRLREVPAHVTGEWRGWRSISLLRQIRGQSWVTCQLSPPSPCPPIGHGSVVCGVRGKDSGSPQCLVNQRPFPLWKRSLSGPPVCLSASLPFRQVLMCPFTGPS